MTKAYWLNGNWFGVQVVYAPNERAWRHLMKTYAWPDMADDPFPTADAHCSTFTNRNDHNEQISVITVNRAKAETHTMPQVVAMLAHEAMHAWRHTREKIKETDPSSEFEAYAIQSIVQFLVCTYIEAHRKPWKSLK